MGKWKKPPQSYTKLSSDGSELSNANASEGSIIGDGYGKDGLPEAMRIAMEKAKEYKKNKGAMDEKSLGNVNSYLMFLASVESNKQGVN